MQTIHWENSLNKSFKYSSLVSASQSLHHHVKIVKIAKKHGGV